MHEFTLDPKLQVVAEVAKDFGCTQRRIQQLIANGDLEARKATDFEAFALRQAGRIRSSTARGVWLIQQQAYSNPIRIIFNALFRSRVRSESTAAAARSREGRITYQQEIPPLFERSLYQPLLRLWGGLARRARVIQSGNINQYVAYIFVIVLIVLLLRAI